LLAFEGWQAWLRKAKYTKGSIFCHLQRNVTPRGALDFSPDKPLSTDMIYKTIIKRAEDAGVKDMYPHVMRHTFITSRKMAHVPEEQIAAITGHAPDVGWKSMSAYLDIGLVGKTARETTPPWLAELVATLVKRS
jgi:integrase